MAEELEAYLLAYCSILEWVSSWESWGDWDSLEMNELMEMNNILHAHEARFGLRTYGVFLHMHIQNLKTLHKDTQEYKSKYP